MKCRARLGGFLLAAIFFIVAIPKGCAESPLETYLASLPNFAGYDIFNVENTLCDRMLTTIEGVWQMTADGDGGIFAIVKDPHTDYYRMIVVDSRDRNVAPGSPMGAIIKAAASGYYDARIYTSVSKGRLSKPKRFTLHLTDEGRLIIQPVNDSHKVSVDFWRLIPYMSRLRISHKHVNDRQKNLDGAVRLFPEPAKPIDGPRIL